MQLSCVCFQQQTKHSSINITSMFKGLSIQPKFKIFYSLDYQNKIYNCFCSINNIFYLE